MKNYRFIVIASILFFGAITQSNAQKDVVDFGDSGEEVVVHAGGDGMETGWVYWFPDEFFEYMPPFPILPPINFPSWPGGGGGGGEPTQECQDAKQNLVNLTRSITMLEETEHQWESDGFIDNGDGQIFPKGSREYNERMSNLKASLKNLTKEFNDAFDAVDEAC